MIDAAILWDNETAYFFRGEQFWGNDRLDFLESRLRDAGLTGR